ncbi:unnamed protein product [Lactuca saligna]|uniref:Uncharacterized protein n=1 Tax=Lactuca saligna TaxID=75948 RepID=A0AA35V6Z6_LACSI|nr:unnamed protein product [Lactuca saligna]
MAMVPKKKDAMPVTLGMEDINNWTLCLIDEFMLKIRNRRLQVGFGIESQRFKVRSEASECGKQKRRRHQVRRQFSSSPSVFGMTTSLVNLKGNASSFQKSLVFCSRATWEGGQYNRDEKSRLDALCLAMELGAYHIDAEPQGEKKKKIKTENYWDWELANETKLIWSLGVIVNNQTVVRGGRSIRGVNISNEEQASVSVVVPSVHETEGRSASLGPTYRDSFFHYKVNCRWLETCTILGKYSSSSDSYNFFHRKGVPLLRCMCDCDHSVRRSVTYRVCVWTVVMLCVLPILDAYTLITRFIRVGGELFGMLISVFFMQEAIKGVISEFHVGYFRELLKMFLLVFLDAFFVPFLGNLDLCPIGQSLSVLLQSPMHTRSLATLERQIMQKKMVKIAKEGKKMEASSLEIYGKMNFAFVQMDPHPQVL